jgi:hypothetical protein
MPPSEIRRGRREDRVPTAPMVRVQQKSTRQNHRCSRDHPAFPAQWFYGLYVLFSVTIAWLPPSPARRASIFASLAPASERQNHTISPSASAAFVNAQPKRPPHPASNVRDDRDTPLLWRRDTRKMLLIWGFEQYRRPAAQWHDGQFSHDAYARFARRAVAVSEAWEGTLLSPFKTRC